jgi:hypothetical protein
MVIFSICVFLRRENNLSAGPGGSMLRKLVILVCLISFAPAAAGAEQLAVLAGSQAAVQNPAQGDQRELNLSPPSTGSARWQPSWPIHVFAVND